MKQKETCAALNDKGKRCRRVAVSVSQYHGDGELYYWKENMPTWVRVALCDQHSERKKKAPR